ncbi:hypothetical protein KPL47_06000 [Clostridium estertheticum]|uniref:hypothetical protein n=1 Tax=Clostridium estertheticum TaxID=238834 RepID=UPI001C0D4AEE|nr:hypothetical protein [Clostridium estertheticum]MBU3175918.1 hypothetical protein [Clostridium estertheticum]
MVKSLCLDIHDEMIRISKGANVKIDGSLFINSFIELINYRFYETQKFLLGCILLAVGKGILKLNLSINWKLGNKE